MGGHVEEWINEWRKRRMGRQGDSKKSMTRDWRDVVPNRICNRREFRGHKARDELMAERMFRDR